MEDSDDGEDEIAPDNDVAADDKDADDVTADEKDAVDSAASPALKALIALFHSLSSAGTRLILTQTENLIDEAAFVTSSLLKPEVPMTRVGVFEEDFPTLLKALNALMARKMEGVTRKDVRMVDPRAWTETKTDGRSQCTVG